ncbi:hypothetical protein EDC01DRAFT_625760, partial [Geopyxis carbonaria]
MNPRILEASRKHQKPEGKKFSYGTAGFRMKATSLDSVVFRAGLLAALRSQKLDGQTIGVMITASHNVPEDNGVKLVDPMGEMLDASWEVHGTTLANAETDEELVGEYEKLVSSLRISSTNPARVIIARDTRESGPALVASLLDALNSVDAEVTD